jgi:CRISPR-associated protein Cas2
MSRRPDPWNAYGEGMALTPSRRAEQPYLFAYDISEPKRARQVLKCLREWRVDGQLSVHETWLAPSLAETLAIEVLDLIDPATDRLLLGRLSRRGGAPVVTLSRAESSPLPLGQPPGDRPVRWSGGWYLLAYDIRDERRLRRVQRVSARDCLGLQRSVYLYSGGGGRLARLLAELAELAVPGEDDLRLYALNGPADLWLLSGPAPPVAEWGGTPRRRPRRSSTHFRGDPPWPS